MPESSDHPDSAKDIAVKLLQAANHGENLMKELDYLSSRHPGSPSQSEVLRQMIDCKNNDQFGGVELLDGAGNPVTNSK